MFNSDASDINSSPTHPHCTESPAGSYWNISGDPSWGRRLSPHAVKKRCFPMVSPHILDLLVLDVRLESCTLMHFETFLSHGTWFLSKISQLEAFDFFLQVRYWRSTMQIETDVSLFGTHRPKHWEITQLLMTHRKKKTTHLVMSSYDTFYPQRQGLR